MNITILPLLRSVGALGIFVFVLILGGCTKQDMVAPTTTQNPVGNPPIVSPIPKTPPKVTIPADNNPLDLNAEIELGRHLFYDKQMSVDNTTSCASCHQPDHGFADVFPFSQGMQGQHGTRNAPGLTNVAFNTAFTWDGKFPSLEKHAPGPMFNSLEMGNNFSNGKDPNAGGDTAGSGYNSLPGNNDTLFLFARLDGNNNSRVVHEADPYSKRTDIKGNNYYGLLKAAWGDPTFSLDHIAKSIAAFERTFISSQSAFDRYNNGDESAISPDAKQGFQLFIDSTKANCVSCHSGYDFTDQQFHNNGITDLNNGKQFVDLGRYGVTKSFADKYKFKTPTLRNVSLTAPWMHDGRFANDQANTELSLESIIKNYKTGGTAIKGSEIHQLNISDQDVAYIGAFLMTLQDDVFKYNTNLSNPWVN